MSNADQFHELKIGPGERKPVKLINTDPFMVNGTIESHPAREIIAEEYIHVNFKVGIGVKNPG